ncbi:MAG: prepilin peptidase [Propionibacteriaceae bacterium]
MDDGLTAVTAAVLTAVLVGVGLRPVLRRLPEPAAGDGKIAYRDLPTPGFLWACSALALGAQLVTWTLLPLQVQPVWTVLALVGVPLAAVDARTTWLPLRLTHAAWLLMVLALAGSWALGLPLADLLRALAGAAVAGALYLLVWAVTRGGFGFGDVRFAPLLGAATASSSATLLIWGLTLGTALGAVHGGTRLLLGRKGGFPYAPSMIAGCYLAVVLLHLVAHPP